MNIFQKLSLAAILCISLNSCEKVIDLNIKDSSPALVIAGDITDAAGPYTVYLSKSIAFSQLNTFPVVANAIVVVSDDMGTVDTFLNNGDGSYSSQLLQGKPGHRYELMVMLDGKIFNATSTMPQPVPFKDLIVKEQTGFGDPFYFPAVVYDDPIGVPNYYLFIQTLNGDTATATFFVRNDRFNDGKTVEATLRDEELLVGDSAMVVMQSIDQDAYNYFNTLSDVDGGSSSAAPANPVSSLSGGALGYFSAHTVQSRTVIR